MADYEIINERVREILATPPIAWFGLRNPAPPPDTPDSPATRALSNALERTIAAGTWNGTSFGRK